MNVNDIVNGGKATGTNTYATNWETKGYKYYNGGNAFNGYTEGPGYWGKTFAIWPPDPSPASTAANPTTMEAISAFSGAKVPGGSAANGVNDWRQNFFYNATGSAPLTDDTMLFQDGSGAYEQQRHRLQRPGRQLRHQLQGHPLLDPELRPQPVPVAAALRQREMYSAIPSDVGGSPVRPYRPLRPHAAEQQHRQRRPALLEGIHRLDARRLARPDGRRSSTRSPRRAASARTSAMTARAQLRPPARSYSTACPRPRGVISNT